MIYFVENPETGLVKIGTSSDVAVRFLTISREQNVTLVLLGVMDGSFEIEHHLHQYFSSSHIRGEWFQKTPELIAYIHENTRVELPPSEMTGIRLTKRTIHYLQYLSALLTIRSGRNYSPDEVIWEAINSAFKEEIEYANKPANKAKNEKHSGSVIE